MMTGRELAATLRKRATEVEALEDIQGFALVLVPTGGAQPTPLGIVVTDKFIDAPVFCDHVAAAMKTLSGQLSGVNVPYGMNTFRDR